MYFYDMHANGVPEIIFSILAVLASLPLFVLCPLPTVWKILKKKETQDFPPYMLVASQSYHFSCYCYLVVVMREPFEFHQWSLLLSNTMSLGFGTIYLLIFSFHNPQVWFLRLWAMIPTFMGGLMWLLSGIISHAWFVKFGWPFISILAIIMYASHIPFVLSNGRDAPTIPGLSIWVCTGCFLNGLAWCIVSFLISTIDPYLSVTNGIGTILGISMLVYLSYSTRRFRVHNVDI